MQDDFPRDPFLDDPVDPAEALDALDDEDAEPTPLDAEERDRIASDLADLEVFQTLLEPVGMRGVVVDCDDCQKTHYFAWDLLRANLRSLLDNGYVRRHEPPFEPDPAEYVTWDFACGYRAGVMAEAAEAQPWPDEPDSH